MPGFVVTVVIENKQGLSDPEGETILRDLVLKEGRDEANGGGVRDNDGNENGSDGCRISEIKTAKMLRMTVDSQDAESAVRDVRKVCDALHLYNPIVSSVDIAAELARE
ncbi:MAG: phosphoribosylformylglycinamidine synthase subunit PurS [Nitrosopumilaceae archaeon]|nr:phosphoribosylformylglycinamidine synthase subunit PurS [Nitrosopumilaceae archaeon]